MTGSQRPASAVLFILFVGGAWGTMYALYPIGLERSGPLWLAALRFDLFFLAALAAGLVMRTGLRAPQTAREWLCVAAYATFNVVLHNVGMITGAGHVPVAMVGIIAGLNPILTVAFGSLLHQREALTGRAYVGLGAGLAGVIVLSLTKTNGAFTVDPWILVVLGGVAAWSAGSVAMKAAGSTLSMLGVAFWGSAIGAVVLQLSAFALEPLPTVDLTLVAVVAFAAVIGGLAAFLVWLRVVRRNGPQQANLVSYVSPVATSLAGYFLLGQRVGPLHAVAYALVALGLFLAVRGFSPERRAEDEPAAAPE